MRLCFDYIGGVGVIVLVVVDFEFVVVGILIEGLFSELSIELPFDGGFIVEVVGAEDEDGELIRVG